ncbi:MAG: hypothetical protein HY544_01250 [Candidatus Diapherotrites archaeon]|uniref:Uncharacterized protein n=1 Tax=Candidatus Iainarchaeum sp. TaxID=3101447 RepID=A0A8T3YM24_9ARCH|nr:hypothetical protein [Candidatus Diapherotrites archaeon]
MIKPWNLLIATFAFILTASIAHAGLYVGYANSDYRLEVYYGNSYSYMATPYTYAYQGQYYFDYPFRVYDTGSYYYFQPGWYSFDSYWRYAPGCNGCYTYYPQNYYYYNDYWTYSPGWMYSYAPSYYGAYFLPPSQPTLVGQQYHPEKEATCDEAKVSADGASLSAGSKLTATAYINNSSRKFMDIQNVQAYVNGFDVQARNVKFDRVIANGSSGKITFELDADAMAKSGSTMATISVYGTFRDGTSCSGNDISKDVAIEVIGAAKPAAKGTETANYVTIGSTSYYKAKETQQAWKDTRPQNTTAQYAGYSTAGKGNAGTYMNNNAGASNAIQQRQGASTTGNTNYGTVQLAALNCDALSVGKESITVPSGEGRTSYFQFRNFAGEDFMIDNIEAVENSPSFTIEAGRDSPKVFAGQSGSIKVRALANETESTSTGTAYLKVNGHFASGMQCETLSENFYITVNAAGGEGVNGIQALVPAEAKLESGSGFISITVQNPSREEVNVRAYSYDASVAPSELSFAPNTSGTRTIAVNGLGQKGKVYYSVQAGGKEIVRKFTMVESVQDRPNPQQPGTVNIPITANDNDQNKDAQKGVAQSSPAASIRGIATAGLSVLSANSAAIGIAIVIVLAALLLAARKQ